MKILLRRAGLVGLTCVAISVASLAAEKSAMTEKDLAAVARTTRGMTRLQTNATYAALVGRVANISSELTSVEGPSNAASPDGKKMARIALLYSQYEYRGTGAFRHKVEVFRLWTKFDLPIDSAMKLKAGQKLTVSGAIHSIQETQTSNSNDIVHLQVVLNDGATVK